MGHGLEWIKKALNPPTITPLGAAVADLLHDLYNGLHHADPVQLKKVAWHDDHHIEFLHYGGLANFDSERLTLLVVRAHDYKLRVEISARAPRYLELMFHLRKREGSNWDRIPTMEDHLALIRRYYPAPIEAK